MITYTLYMSSTLLIIKVYSDSLLCFQLLLITQDTIAMHIQW